MVDMFEPFCLDPMGALVFVLKALKGVLHGILLGDFAVAWTVQRIPQQAPLLSPFYWRT